MAFATQIISSGSGGTTTTIAEGTNLYYTNARARAALSASPTSSLLYNPQTGAMSLDITNGIITTASTIDDVNKAFVFTTIPSLLVINGSVYQKTGGAYTWTWSGQTATLNNAVGVNGSIWALP